MGDGRGGKSGGWVSGDTRVRIARQVIDEVVTAAVAADALGVSRQAVSGWVRKYRTSGADSLATKPIPGRPPKLSDGQAADLYARIVNHSPRDWGLSCDLWTTDAVRKLIKQEYGVDLAASNVGKLLRTMGLTVQRPLYRAYQQNPEAVEEWRTTTLPEIQAKAKEEGAAIFYGDESAVRSDYHAGGTWAPAGRTPIVYKTGDRFTVNMISAINGQGRSFFAVIDGGCNSETFIEFCEKLMADVGGPVFLIVDNASYHKSKATRKYVASTEGKLRLFYLPPYAPELNPDELVWCDIKAGDIGRNVVRNRAEMESRIFARAQRLRDFPKIVRGYFKKVGLEALTV